jgi:hypothetical protein
MAGVKISALPPVSAALLTDFFPVVQGGVTQRETLQQVFTLFQTNLNLGTAAFKNASDNTKAVVSSISGAIVSGDLAVFADTAGTIKDTGLSSANIFTSAVNNPDVQANIIFVDVVVAASALASAGTVILQPSSGTKQYKIRNIWINGFGGTNFSGGGGNRNIAIGDGTTVWTIIPAATLQSLVNATWGSTAVPFPASSAINQGSGSGMPIYAVYNGGTTDYSTGSVTISIEFNRTN